MLVAISFYLTLNLFCHLYHTFLFFIFFNHFLKTEFNKNFFLLRNLFNLDFNHIYLQPLFTIKEKKWGKKLQKVARGPKTGTAPLSAKDILKNLYFALNEHKIVPCRHCESTYSNGWNGYVHQSCKAPLL